MFYYTIKFPKLDKKNIWRASEFLMHKERENVTIFKINDVTGIRTNYKLYKAFLDYDIVTINRKMYTIVTVKETENIKIRYISLLANNS